MVFIDTPLDIAMVRRILRDTDRAIRPTTDEALQHVKDELCGYEARARPIYEHFQEEMRARSDLIVDGTLGVDEVVERIVCQMQSRLVEGT